MAVDFDADFFSKRGFPWGGLVVNWNDEGKKARFENDFVDNDEMIWSNDKTSEKTIERI